jgi:hypothetical protein
MIDLRYNFAGKQIPLEEFAGPAELAPTLAA